VFRWISASNSRRMGLEGSEASSTHECLGPRLENRWTSSNYYRGMFLCFYLCDAINCATIKSTALYYQKLEQANENAERMGTPHLTPRLPTRARLTPSVSHH
jgi:hypothetical protein